MTHRKAQGSFEKMDKSSREKTHESNNRISTESTASESNDSDSTSELLKFPRCKPKPPRPSVIDRNLQKIKRPSDINDLNDSTDMNLSSNSKLLEFTQVVPKPTRQSIINKFFEHSPEMTNSDNNTKKSLELINFSKGPINIRKSIIDKVFQQLPDDTTQKQDFTNVNQNIVGRPNQRVHIHRSTPHSKSCRQQISLSGSLFNERLSPIQSTTSKKNFLETIIGEIYEKRRINELSAMDKREEDVEVEMEDKEEERESGLSQHTVARDKTQKRVGSCSGDCHHRNNRSKLTRQTVTQQNEIDNSNDDDGDLEASRHVDKSKSIQRTVMQQNEPDDDDDDADDNLDGGYHVPDRSKLIQQKDPNDDHLERSCRVNNKSNVVQRSIIYKKDDNDSGVTGSSHRANKSKSFQRTVPHQNELDVTNRSKLIQQKTTNCKHNDPNDDHLEHSCCVNNKSKSIRHTIHRTDDDYVRLDSSLNRRSRTIESRNKFESDDEEDNPLEGNRRFNKSKSIQRSATQKKSDDDDDFDLAGSRKDGANIRIDDIDKCTKNTHKLVEARDFNRRRSSTLDSSYLLSCRSKKDNSSAGDDSDLDEDDGVRLKRKKLKKLPNTITERTVLRKSTVPTSYRASTYNALRANNELNAQNTICHHVLVQKVKDTSTQVTETLKKALKTLNREESSADDATDVITVHLNRSDHASIGDTSVMSYLDGAASQKKKDQHTQIGPVGIKKRLLFENGGWDTSKGDAMANFRKEIERKQEAIKNIAYAVDKKKREDNKMTMENDKRDRKNDEIEEHTDKIDYVRLMEAISVIEDIKSKLDVTRMNQAKIGNRNISQNIGDRDVVNDNISGRGERMNEQIQDENWNRVKNYILSLPDKPENFIPFDRENNFADDCETNFESAKSQIDDSAENYKNESVRTNVEKSSKSERILRAAAQSNCTIDKNMSEVERKNYESDQRKSELRKSRENDKGNVSARTLEGRKSKRDIEAIFSDVPSISPKRLMVSQMIQDDDQMEDNNQIEVGDEVGTSRLNGERKDGTKKIQIKNMIIFKADNNRNNLNLPKSFANNNEQPKLPVLRVRLERINIENFNNNISKNDKEISNRIIESDFPKKSETNNSRQAPFSASEHELPLENINTPKKRRLNKKRKSDKHTTKDDDSKTQTNESNQIEKIDTTKNLKQSYSEHEVPLENINTPKRLNKKRKSDKHTTKDDDSKTRTNESNQIEEIDTTKNLKRSYCEDELLENINSPERLNGKRKSNQGTTKGKGRKVKSDKFNQIDERQTINNSKQINEIKISSRKSTANDGVSKSRDKSGAKGKHKKINTTKRETPKSKSKKDSECIEKEMQEDEVRYGSGEGRKSELDKESDKENRDLSRQIKANSNKNNKRSLITNNDSDDDIGGEINLPLESSTNGLIEPTFTDKPTKNKRRPKLFSDESEEEQTNKVQEQTGGLRRSTRKRKPWKNRRMETIFITDVSLFKRLKRIDKQAGLNTCFVSKMSYEDWLKSLTSTQQKTSIVINDNSKKQTKNNKKETKSKQSSRTKRKNKTTEKNDLSSDQDDDSMIVPLPLSQTIKKEQKRRWQQSSDGEQNSIYDSTYRSIRRKGSTMTSSRES